MKYLVFEGDNYYPIGVEDFVVAFDTLEDATTRARASQRNWSQVAEFDGSNLRLVVDLHCSSWNPPQMVTNHEDDLLYLRKYQIVGNGPRWEYDSIGRRLY